MNTGHIHKNLVAAAIAGVAGFAAVACAAPRSAPPGTSTVDNNTVISTSTPRAPSAVALSPNDRGYVRVEFQSGLVRCSLNVELVACQTSAHNWPSDADGQPFHCASVTSDGQFQWVKADLGALEGIVTMDQQTYSAQGWTIIATAGGTKFTNDRTGHGMSVSTETVQPF